VTAQRRGPAATRRRAVVAILAVGLGLAAAVYATAPPAEPENPDVADILASKKYQRQVEVIGGKANAFAADANALVASLWEGKARAYTIAALTVLAACAYLLLARAYELGAQREEHDRRPP
jgi:hypothetical protein